MGENTGWVELAHTGGGPLAVEMAVYERLLDIEGEALTDSLVPNKDFVIYPSEVILYPGESARVQIMYKGKRPNADMAFLLFSKEVPLPLAEEQGGVQMGVSVLMNYYTILALETGNRGALTFVSSRVIGNGNIEVIVENKSRGRVPVDKWGITVGGQRITSFTGTKNSVMPGQQRRITFPFNRALTAKEFSIGPN